MNNSPDQQTNAGKTPGPIRSEDISYGMKHFCHVLSDSPKFAEYLNGLLAKHIPQVTAEDVEFAEDSDEAAKTVSPLQWRLKIAEIINTRLRPRLVPEAAAVEWEVDECPACKGSGSFKLPFDSSDVRNCPKCEGTGIERRRKKQTESPTQTVELKYGTPIQPPQVAVDGVTPDNPDGEITLPMKEYEAMREQLAGLKKEQAESTEQILGLQRQRTDLASRLFTAQKEREDAIESGKAWKLAFEGGDDTVKDKDAEIARLREEVGALKNQKDQWESACHGRGEECRVLKTELATLRTAPAKGLTVEQVIDCCPWSKKSRQADFKEWEKFTDTLNAILSTQSVSPPPVVVEKDFVKWLESKGVPVWMSALEYLAYHREHDAALASQKPV